MLGKFICWITRRHKMDRYSHTCIHCGKMRRSIQDQKNVG